MGPLQRTLETLLKKKGQATHKKLATPKDADIERADLRSDISSVYKSLGGVGDFKLNLRSWDIAFEGIAIELDEYLHFNRYRFRTLESSLYTRLPGFPLEEYVKYCSDHEGRCLSAGSYGGRWTNKSAERQFGPAGNKKELNGAGAPRWKQRAFYDFVKDLSPILIGVHLVRIAVWDKIHDNGIVRTVEDILKSPTNVSVEGIVELIHRRSV
jgi:hypothetical protein